MNTAQTEAPLVEPVIAFQGERGAYSEEAIRCHFGPEVEALPCESFAAIFESIKSGQASCGICRSKRAPIRGRSASLELLMSMTFACRASILCRCSLPGAARTSPKDVRTVRLTRRRVPSAPYAGRRGGSRSRWYTRRAPRASWQPTRAAHRRNRQRARGELYDLTVLERGSSDESENSTRSS